MENRAAAIQFDGKFGLGAIEIENVPIDGMLAAKFNSSKRLSLKSFQNLAS